MFPYGAAPGKSHPRKLYECSCGWRACFLFTHRQGWVLTTLLFWWATLPGSIHTGLICVSRSPQEQRKHPVPTCAPSFAGSQAIAPGVPVPPRPWNDHAREAQLVRAACGDQYGKASLKWPCSRTEGCGRCSVVERKDHILAALGFHPGLLRCVAGSMHSIWLRFNPSTC